MLLKSKVKTTETETDDNIRKTESSVQRYRPKPPTHDVLEEVKKILGKT